MKIRAKKLIKGFVSLITSIALASGALTVIAPPAEAATITLTDSEFLKFNRATGYTNLVGDGTKAGNIVLYKNVGIFGGVKIDCAITTVAVSGSISNYDNPGSASTAAGYQDNFMMNTVGGEVTIKMEFFEGGTYTGAGTGIPVVLQNVKITSIDLDSSSAAGSYQYTDFTGFQKYSMMSPTNLGVSALTSPSRVRFIAAKTGSRSAVPEDQVMVKYDSMQSITMNFGNVVAGSTNYFGLVFSGWPGTGVPVEYSNVYNVPPFSTSTTLRVPDNVTTILPLSAFGNYSDLDSNPFNQVRIVTGPAAGTLEYLNGSSWTNVTNGQTVTVADIQQQKLRYTTSASSSLTFQVHDGLDYSASTYTLTLTKVTNTQTITFANPGVKAPNSTPFASGATTDATGLTPTLTSTTLGVCTVSGLDITPIAAGTCSITATQTGDATYGAALPVTQTFPVDGKTAQTITFNNPGTKTYNATSFVSGATASSALAVTLVSLTPTICTIESAAPLNIKMLTVGTCQIQASQDGNTTFAPAPSVIQSFLIQAGAPSVATTAASSVGTTTATLNGTVNSFGSVTTDLSYCYGTATNLAGCTSTTLANVTTNSATSSPKAIIGLTAGTKYYFQIRATTGSGTSTGTILNFTTSTSAPTLSTTQITPNVDVTTSTANLKGNVSANGKTLKTGFCYSKYSSLNSSGKLYYKKSDNTKCYEVNSNTTTNNVNITKAISSLSSDTTYFYQTYISYTDGGSDKTVYASPLRFSTRSMNVATDAASGVTDSAATLNGRMKTNGNSTATNTFCYNTSGSTSEVGVLDSAKSTCINATPATNTNTAWSGATSAALTGLSSGATYYFQAIVKDGSNNKVYGGILSFTTTELAQTVSTSGATDIVAARATLNGSINPASTTSTTATFCYGTSNTDTTPADGALDTCTSVSAAPSSLTGTTTRQISAVVDGLAAGTTYYFQAVGARAGGTTVRGAIRSFVAGNPLAITSNATDIALDGGVGGTFKATLRGAVKSNGIETTPKFCYGTTTTDANSDGALDTCTLVVTNLTSVADDRLTSASIFKEVTGLTAGQTYYFQAVAEGTGGRTTFGSVFSFKAASPPTATTVAATSLLADGATLNGTIVDNGDPALAYFCLSSSDSNREIAGILDSCIGGIRTASLAAGAATLSTTGLKPGTTYYFQVIAENGSGTAYGSILSFTTLAGPPGATTLAPAVSATASTLRGEAQSLGADTTVTFCHTTSNTQTVTGILNDCSDPTKVFSATPGTVLGTNSLTVPVEYAISGLVAGTTYYFQAKTTNSQGSTYGAVLSYVSGAPTVVTQSATSVATTTATINGTVLPNGSNITSVKYCYVVANDFPTLDASGAISDCLVIAPALTPVVAPVDAPTTTVAGATATVTNEPLNLTGLATGSTYYFQIIATNGRGTSYGDVLSFTVGVPVVTTGPVSGAPTSSFATVTGVLNPTGDLDALTSFCLSQSDDEGATPGLLATCAQYELANLATSIVAPGTSDINISYLFGGLTPNTTYYYQAIVDGVNADNIGEIKSFTTAQAKITFNNNTGAGAMSQQSSPIKAPITANTFTKDAHTFAGWNTLANGNGTSYANGADYAFDSDVTLYAQWTNTGFTVSFNNNNGSGAMAPQSSLVAANLTPNTFTRSGYTFTGWNTLALGGGTPYGDGAQYAFTGNAVLFAQWTLNYVAPTPTPTPVTPVNEEKKEPIVIKLPQYTPKPSTIGTNKASGSVVTTSSKPSKVEVPEIKAEAPVEVKTEIKKELEKKVEITPSTGALEVKPLNGWTGKLQVPVVTVVDGKETEVFTDIVVNPDKPEAGKYLPEKTILQTSIKWDPSPSQVVKYIVSVNGKEICETTTTTCKVPDAVGPASKIEVTAIGNDDTKSEVTLPAYKPEKPVPALVVNFAESSAKLSAKAKKELERIAAIIEREGYTRLIVDGHTDSQGGQKNASALSKARAKATKAYLDELLPDVKFVLSGKGLEAPVATNKTEKGRAANRRAELRVW